MKTPKRAFRFTLGLLLVALLLFQVGIALAHARMKTATILPDAVVTSVPASLTVTFTEETSPTQSKLSVSDASGKQVDKGDLKVDGASVAVSLNTLTNGKYTVKFRSFTEDDGVVVDGQYSFTVASGGTAAPGNVSNATQSESEMPASTPKTGTGETTQNSLTLIIFTVALIVICLVAGTWLVVKRRKIS
jgi:methionine-rich copper-binding protein CopC